ncbi:single-strand DNA-binding protein [Sinorhizobium medicae]
MTNGRFGQQGHSHRQARRRPGSAPHPRRQAYRHDQHRDLGNWRDRSTGERRDKTEWHRVVIFNESLADIAEEHLKKGAKVYVEGQLQTRKWQDNQGHDRYSTEVVLQGFNATLTMLDGRREGSGYRAGGDGPEDYGIDGDRAAGRSSSQPSQSFERELADDIPF